MPWTDVDRRAAPLSMPLIAVSRQSVRRRTEELAVLAGRLPPHVTQSDYEQALRELTGESEPERQQARLENL